MPEFTRPAFTRIRSGLYERKHVERIGGWPMTLYGWLHTQVWFKGPNAGKTMEPYTHRRAAAALGVPENSVKAWFQKLRHFGYVSSEPVRYGLEVTITKYGQPDTSISPSADQGDTHMSPSRAQGDTTTSQADISTSQPDTSISPSARPIKEARARSQEIQEIQETSPPTPSARSWQADLAEAFMGVGLPAPDLDGNEGLSARKLLRHTTPELLAMCWQEIRAGEYGDEAGWLQRNLSFVTLAERQRFTNWLMEKAGKSKPPPKRTNGRAYAGPGAVAAYHAQRGTFDGAGTDTGRRGLGGSQAQPRLSGQLP